MKNQSENQYERHSREAQTCDRCGLHIGVGDGRIPTQEGIYHNQCAPTEECHLLFDGEEFDIVEKQKGGIHIWIALSNHPELIPDWIHTTYSGGVLSEGHLCKYYYYPDGVIECYGPNGLENRWTMSNNDANKPELRNFICQIPSQPGISLPNVIGAFESLDELISDVENGCPKLKQTHRVGDGTIEVITDALEIYERGENSSKEVNT